MQKNLFVVELLLCMYFKVKFVTKAVHLTSKYEDEVLRKYVQLKTLKRQVSVPTDL